MFDIESLEIRNETDYYTSYDLVNNCVLFVGNRTITTDIDGERVTREASFSERASMFASTFSCAMIAGQTMLQKGDCKEFSLQTVECVADDTDTNMLVLLTK